MKFGMQTIRPLVLTERNGSRREVPLIQQGFLTPRLPAKRSPCPENDRLQRRLKAQDSEIPRLTRVLYEKYNALN
jgi:hypothetical protein